jgi:hypothetical protein
LHKLPVNKRRSLETAATYGTTTKDEATVSVAVPEGIYTDVGDIGVVLSPTVIGNIDGAFKYLKDYSYICWEQRLTKAVAAAQYIFLKDYLTGKIEWTDPEKAVAGTLASAGRFQAPNGGMTYWIASDQYVSPYLSAYTALAFGWLRQKGYEVPQQVETNLHEYLSTQLRQEVFPAFYTKGMASTVRVVAWRPWQRPVRPNPKIFCAMRPTCRRWIFWQGPFHGSGQNRRCPQEIVAKTVDRILGHASRPGQFQFNEPWDDSYKYILATLAFQCGRAFGPPGCRDKVEGIGDIPSKWSVPSPRPAATATMGNTQETSFA